MASDYLLVTGIVLVVFVIPSLLNGWSEGRVSRMGGVLLLVAVGLIGYAIATAPQGYTFANIPDAVLRVIADIMN